MNDMFTAVQLHQSDHEVYDVFRFDTFLAIVLCFRVNVS